MFITEDQVTETVLTLCVFICGIVLFFCHNYFQHCKQEKNGRCLDNSLLLWVLVTPPPVLNKTQSVHVVLKWALADLEGNMDTRRKVTQNIRTLWFECMEKWKLTWKKAWMKKRNYTFYQVILAKLLLPVCKHRSDFVGLIQHLFPNFSVFDWQVSLTDFLLFVYFIFLREKCLMFIVIYSKFISVQFTVFL